MADEGVLGGIARTQVAGIPIGAAATGALVAGLFDGLMGFLPAGVPVWALKGVGAWASVQWGSRWLGRTAAETAALFLTYDAIQEFINLRGMTSGLFSRVTGGQKAAMGQGNKTQMPGYYEALKGGTR